MNSSVCFEQKGIIESITNHRVRIRMDRDSACGHCEVSGICNLSGTERIIEIDDAERGYRVGEAVQVSIARRMGNKAVVLGYLLPFALLVSALIIFTECALPEWMAGTFSILILVPYYFFLYLFRERLRKRITFSIRKIA
jgi:sigma-E factor negative regulatory protein RseC